MVEITKRGGLMDYSNNNVYCFSNYTFYRYGNYCTCFSYLHNHIHATDEKETLLYHVTIMFRFCFSPVELLNYYLFSLNKLITGIAI